MCLSRPLIFLWLLVPVMPATAATVYKCVDTHGHVSYQDTPCTHSQQQSIQHLHVDATPPAQVLAPARAASVVPHQTPAPPRPQPRIPPPVVFACTNATNGKIYLSQTGITRAYFAPLGMLGAIGVPLASTYGAQQDNHVGSNVPEFMPSPPPTLVSGNYTRVRDTCQPLPPDAACAALAKRNTKNNDQLAIAFPEQKPPLLKERKYLKTWMAGCYQ